MAQQGFYRDPPSRRMAYDADGTIMVTIEPTTNVVTELSSGDKQYYNNEEANNPPSSAHFSSRQASNFYVLMFPELRDITHVYLNSSRDFFASTYHASIWSSSNTTSGVDGDWTLVTVLNPIPNTSATTTPDFRNPLSLGMTAVKAIKIQYGPVDDNLGTDPRVGKIHFWGFKHAGETPHRIDFAYTDGSEMVQDEDYGDQPRDSTRTWGTSDGFNLGQPLYLKNRSPDKVANDVHLTCGALTGGMASDVTLSKDNFSYTTTLIWSEIQPLELIGPLWVRHTTQSDEALGVRNARLKIVVGSWV